MQRIAKFLKDTFIPADPQRLPATSSEMTLHDALRICTGRVRHDTRSASPQIALRPFDVCWYRTEAELRDQWRCLSHTHFQTVNLTVILILGNFLRGNLRELIRWRRFAHRLVLVPNEGRWPGNDSFGDLALASGSLGWHSIEICRDLHDSPEKLASSYCRNERVLVVLPANSPAGDAA